jgi:hypothetical protein
MVGFDVVLEGPQEIKPVHRKAAMSARIKFIKNPSKTDVKKR